MSAAESERTLSGPSAARSRSASSSRLSTPSPSTVGACGVATGWSACDVLRVESSSGSARSLRAGEESVMTRHLSWFAGSESMPLLDNLIWTFRHPHGTLPYTREQTAGAPVQYDISKEAPLMRIRTDYTQVPPRRGCVRARIVKLRR